MKVTLAVLITLSLFAALPLGAQPDSRPLDPWLGKDKVSHFAFSLGVVGFSYHILSVESGFSPEKSRGHSAGVAISLGLAKELRDGTRPGNAFSLKDLAADLLGTAAGLLFFSIK